MRRLAAVLVAAFLVGGVAQAWLWRLDVQVLTAAVTTQFAWALVLYAAGWTAPRRSRWAVLSGALAGAVLIGSYYLCQALADGAASATDQFAQSRGPAWVAATIAVGAVLGLLGGWSARVGQRPVRAGFGLLTMAAALVLGPLVLIGLYGGDLPATARIVVPLVYGAVGLVLAARAVRRVPRRCLVRAALAAAAAGVVGLGLLVLLMTRVLYRTF
ncbi:hypothetical protein [Nocardioides jiangxiensis]|uniref:Uncharacterized protein n=1 Tax=Nocardioides jiangxiensis TaxID=3064524 RepID=A0ABT9B4J9_9ACTN|nr:hypothetical protein [Nocardioides sp. WY-20]MDO7869663.1 hypothetical protein [Nocardioides sp. WY-20]